jgi:hypothetical protein
LIEIRACARDLRSRMDPESAPGGSNPQNPPKPLPAQFGQVHGSSPYIRLLIEPGRPGERPTANCEAPKTEDYRRCVTNQLPVTILSWKNETLDPSIRMPTTRCAVLGDRLARGVRNHA